jgi:FixJ family two-component response regulator
MRSTQPILIVDDDPEMLMIVSALVAKAGFQAKTAATFESFKRELANNPLAILLDLVMPGKASERIVEHMADIQSKIPLFFITGAIPEDISMRQEHALARGVVVHDVLIKPFWSKEVEHALHPLVSSAA